MDALTHPVTLPMVLHPLIAIAIAVRVIMQRPATGVALAWILLVVALPLIGAVTYLLIGERRLGRRRQRRLLMERDDFRQLCDSMIAEGLTAVDWALHPAAARGMDRLGRSATGSPTVHGSRIELLSDTPSIFARLVEDIDAAKTSLSMEFYIWNEGGAADTVLDAVIRAARRGVACRLLIDAIGGGPWWRSDRPPRLSAAGVDLRPALPVGLMRTVFGRTDLRLHRKVAVIDGRVAWTGSMNLVDPRYFKQDAGVGQWVDAIARAEGAVVAPLTAIVTGDWMVETGEQPRELTSAAAIEAISPQGSADIQVIPSGPGETGNALLQMLLAIINAAEERLIITTPYLVPDSALLWALRGAAGRGVAVSIILPEKVDSHLTRYASRSYYQDLLDGGIALHHYPDGLLHTKSLTVDGRMAMFGTVNFDMRSLWLNYEVTLFVYDADFTAALQALQEAYRARSRTLDPAAWAARPALTRFAENAARLVGPLL